MKTRAVAGVVAILVLVSMLSAIAPAMAQPGRGPKYDKYVAPLLDEDEVRCGQAIFNTNPEDDGSYELEVEIEECLALADMTVDVYLDGNPIGTLYVDTYGNGKETFYVSSISTSSTVGVGTVLTSDVWLLWVKAPGPK
jgi:hypothetical protein